jgi:hypothetical protein
MKTPNILLALLGICLPFALCGQDADTTTVQKDIPTEVSEPPYEVGDLVLETGYYIERGEEPPKINLRIEDNKFRLYWIDGDGLIAEPEYTGAVVRLTGSVRGRPYHKLERLPGGAGLGSSLLVVPPHIFNVVLVLLPEDADAEPVSYHFRYTPEFDAVTDPTNQAQN